MATKNKITINKEDFKKALEEAINWENHLTQHEKAFISYKEAKNRVLNRILNKYFE